jgi:uncharacterized membrane protein YgcG
MGGARKPMRRYFLAFFLGGGFAALGPVVRFTEALFLSSTITFVLLTALLSNHVLLAAVRSAGSNKLSLPGLLRKFNLRRCGCGEAAFCCGGGLGGGGELGGGGASSFWPSLGLWSWRSVSASSSSALPP